MESLDWRWPANKGPRSECIHEPDQRDLVDEYDFADGGKF